MIDLLFQDVETIEQEIESIRRVIAATACYLAGIGAAAQGGVTAVPIHFAEGFHP